MKRRVASLPPVSLPTFNEKVLAVQASSTAAAAKASFEKTCVACQKTFYSENSYQNHIKSSKHKSREARMSREHADDASSVMSSTFSLGEPINKTQENDVSKAADSLKAATIEEEDEGEDEPDNGEFSPSRCLFCNNKESDMNANIEHMLKSHGMFVPEKEYLVDAEGLIKWLYRKINENNECLYCHAIRNNPAGARTHMRDKGHCMIAFETEDEQIEIGQYYDFRSTYSDDDDDDSTSDVADGGVKVTSEGDDDGWETDASSVDEEEDEQEEERKLALSRKNNAVVLEDEFELHLPSGRTVGHRSLAKYYRQNLHNYLTPSEREERQLAIENGEIEPEEPKPRGRNLNRAVVSRANGGSGMVGVPEPQRRAVTKAEHKQNDRAQRQEFRYRARVNRAANHQKHYRVCSSLSRSYIYLTDGVSRIPSFNDSVCEWRKLVAHGGLFHTMNVMFLRLICLRIPLSILHMLFLMFMSEERGVYSHMGNEKCLLDHISSHGKCILVTSQVGDLLRSESHRKQSTIESDPPREPCKVTLSYKANQLRCE